MICSQRSRSHSRSAIRSPPAIELAPSAHRRPEARHAGRPSETDLSAVSGTGERAMRTAPGGEQPSAELEMMPEAECLRRLALNDFGRLAIVVDGRPVIFPVNYAV